jgi:hypothetical protein
MASEQQQPRIRRTLIPPHNRVGAMCSRCLHHVATHAVTLHYADHQRMDICHLCEACLDAGAMEFVRRRINEKVVMLQEIALDTVETATTLATAVVSGTVAFVYDEWQPPATHHSIEHGLWTDIHRLILESRDDG